MEGDASLEQIRGVIENVVYYNEGNDYAVLEIVAENDLLVTAVGNVPIPCAGENVILGGRWIYHKEFGKQFSIETYEKTLPQESEGILQYLCSHTVKGVGPITARKIVERFGNDTFDVIENHPEWLADIQGITMKKAAIISESFRSQNGLREVLMFCKNYMSMAEASRVYKKLGDGAVGLIAENPYLLCEETCGLSFLQADDIAKSMGYSPESDHRIYSGIKYVLSYNAQINGHTCLPYEKLIGAASALLEISADTVRMKLDDFLSCGELASYKDEELFVMTNEISDAEGYIAKRLINMDSEAPAFSIGDITAMIERLEDSFGIKYAGLQNKAIVEALRGGVTVITGGPGTGKTTIVKALISIFRTLDIKTVLAAPTGRAAKRMSEATSAEAKTVHRMLEMEKESEHRMHFGRNATNPLDEAAVIVDEASMIDTPLMNALLRAMKRGSRLILIGDSNQLPSVGAGNVLADVIASGRVRTVALTEIFRQSERSLIVTNAHKINNGEMPNLSSVDGDFFFVRRDRAEDIADTVTSLILNRLPSKYGRGIKEKIQVITPSKKGYGGVEILNAKLQESLNPPSKNKAEKSSHGLTFRVGDRVMQSVNNYEIEWTRGSAEGLGIFNGDIGVVDSIDLEAELMTVRYDDKLARYTFDILEELELAYAITVHKSQGSEYPVVIIPAYFCAPMLMTRNLLYTAITRAKNMVVMVGNAGAVVKMTENKAEIMRYTTLMQRLTNY